MRRYGLLGSLVVAIALVAFAGTSRADVFAPVVASLDEPARVVTEMRSREARELPVEALAAYVSGMEAWKLGRAELAERRLELAALLDPGFPEAHFALARVRLFRDPRAAFDSLVDGLRASVSTFAGQHLLIVNVVFGLALLLAAAFVVLVVYAALVHLPRFHHSLAEALRMWLPASMAAGLAVVLLAVPALWHTGLLPLAFLFAGLLWPWMRRGERGWIAGLGGVVLVAPFLLWGASPLLFSPLDPAGPSFLLSRAGTSAHSPELVVSLSEARSRAPRDPDICFALASVEKRGGNYAVAETLYEEAAGLGASEAAVRNNLGVIAFLREDYNRALDYFQRSLTADPGRAAPHFNLSQTYAKKLYFEKADHELREANRLSIDRVRLALREADGEARRTLMDETLPAASVWRAAAAGPRRMPSLPADLALWFPGSLWLFTVLGAGCFAAGLKVGRRLHRLLPSLACANCGRAICRRCLKRIRQSAYCAPCGDILLRIQSQSYSRLVLDSQARRKRRLATFALRAGVWIFPGLQAARRGRAGTAALQVFAALAAGLWLVAGRPPVTRLAWLGGMPTPAWPEVPLAATLAVLVISGLSAARRRPSSRTARPDAGAGPDPFRTDDAPERAA